MKYVTDKEIDKTIKDIKNQTEEGGEKAVTVMIKLLKEMRDLLKTPTPMWKKDKVHKVPTGNKDDVIVGGK